jgi:NADH dehydrogenase/NADH:ubiquinone oxidoreductase subunit G
VARQTLPAGVRAAVLTGDFVDCPQLDRLDLLIMQDCYPTAASERAAILLPVATLAEVDGTFVDGKGLVRPLRKACDGPGMARPDWQIVCELARTMGAAGFSYPSAAAIAAEMNATGARLRLRRPAAPPAATDPTRRRTYFRGHCLEEKVSGLRDLSAVQPAAAAVVGG